MVYNGEKEKHFSKLKVALFKEKNFYLCVCKQKHIYCHLNVDMIFFFLGDLFRESRESFKDGDPLFLIKMVFKSREHERSGLLLSSENPFSQTNICQIQHGPVGNGEADLSFITRPLLAVRLDRTALSTETHTGQNARRN